MFRLLTCGLVFMHLDYMVIGVDRLRVWMDQHYPTYLDFSSVDGVPGPVLQRDLEGPVEGRPEG